MSEGYFDAGPVLSGLKDFQRRTVDYVFERFFGKAATSRFLVADEVGLGKTLVARGVVARALEHLQGKVDRVDVIYVCTNAAIAAQNVNRLNVSGQHGFTLASRLTLLPTQVQHLKKNRVNFVSFTPGTTFDMRSRGGRAEERALIFKMLQGAEWDKSRGFFNLMQAAVRRDNWSNRIKYWSCPIDEELTESYRKIVNADKDLVRRLSECCGKFRRYRDTVPQPQLAESYEVIGDLRNRLAKTCIRALEPDIVILDEFQRFKDLLDGKDDAANLACSLFNYEGVRTLLLSATPYKMLSLDHEQDDDHYRDFLRTLDFLFEGMESEVSPVCEKIQEYRRQLFDLKTDDDNLGMIAARDDLQRSLMRVMCRTERVGITKRLDSMLEEPPKEAPLGAEDLKHAAATDRVARIVGARETIEYWKSSPYLLNFLRDYELCRKIDFAKDSPPEGLAKAIRDARRHVLKEEQLDGYQDVDPGCGRMRALFDDTIENGLWRLLWIPPALAYTEPGGAYATVGNVTKSLVFSAWSVVPDAIAAICSYEAERRMTNGLDRSVTHGNLYSKLKAHLRFAKESTGRLTGMPVIGWLLPSATLAAEVDPLAIAIQEGKNGPVSRETALDYAESRCQNLIDNLPVSGADSKPDVRWYWAALAMLEKKTGVSEWVGSPNGWVSVDREDVDGLRSIEHRFSDHLVRFEEAAESELQPGLGRQPEDLARVLAEFALAAPGTCALRALKRAAPDLDITDPVLLSAAARVAGGFRTLFNLPETIALLQGSGEDSYWRRTLGYCLDGNLQAVLDEQVHVLVEQLGVADHDSCDRIAEVSRSLNGSLSIRSAQIKIDELKAPRKRIIHSGFNSRCRFALRFGDLRDKDNAVARADAVREAFNSPFRPFVLASTSIGQEGLDFHTWCHAVVHWNLPSSPVDLEQREGRVHRYKGHAVRKNIAEYYGIEGLGDWCGIGDPWTHLFKRASNDRPEGCSDLVPFWVYEEGSARIQRIVPLLPFSREVGQLDRLRTSLALYRLVFGQPRQEEMLAYISKRLDPNEVEKAADAWRISLQPTEN